MGFTNLKESLGPSPKRCLTVAWGLDSEVLLACREALDQGFLAGVTVTAPPDQVKTLAEEVGLNLDGFSIRPAETPEEGASEAVRLIREGQCDLLMKGGLKPALFCACPEQRAGIRAQELLSHVAVMELPTGRLALLTDAAMNIKPDLYQKQLILDNAIRFAWSIGLKHPKAAVLASIETVNPQMQDTIDAACLTLMGKRGQFTKPATVDGPLAFDNAYSLEAARQKGIESEVAGQADIFMVQDITSGNLLYKALTYVAQLSIAGVVVGASCPIILTSRADSAPSKLNAIALACQALAGS